MVAALERLPAAQTRIAGEFPETEFVRYANVPVFAEHETITSKGRRLKFTRHELAAIVERCNRRIRESGDYAAITVGHTADPVSVASGQAVEPEVIGFAGPFRIGTVGEGEKRRYAILADLNVYKDDAAKVRRYPRRSPELWVEDRYEDMFLDPIALLGGQAPRLDMGLLYSAVKNGREVERYAAACAGPLNSAIAGHAEVTAKKKYAGEQPPGASSMISPDDVKAIVDAMEQLDWVQWVKAQMASEGQAGAGDPGMAGADAGAPPPADGMGAAPGGDMGAPPPPTPGGDMGAPPPDAGGLPDDKQRMAGGMVAFKGNTPAHKQLMPVKAPPPPKKYGAAGGELDGADGGPSQGDIDADGDGEAAGSYQEAAAPAKYSRLSAELAAMKKQLATQQQQLNAERAKRINAERYSQLTGKRQHLRFDLDKEADRCLYSKMNDEAFAEHLAAMDENYQPMPYGELFVPETVAAGPAGFGRERYNKQASDRAKTICEQKIAAGESPDYGAILEQVVAGTL